LILVAATALGLVLVRYIVTLNLLNDQTGSNNRTVRSDRMYLLAIHLVSPILTALSLAAFVIGLRQPRLSLRRLAREPGFVAMSVVVMTTVYFIVHLALRVIANYYSEPPLFSTHILWVLSNMFSSVGWNIAIAWSVLALQGNWRLRSIRDGKLSAILGCTWVAAWILTDGRQIFRMIRINYFS
jgi:hypothetical protein